MRQIGFEGIIHLAEETRDAKRVVPQAVFWSIFTNIVLGFLMVITFVVNHFVRDSEPISNPALLIPWNVSFACRLWKCCWTLPVRW